MMKEKVVEILIYIMSELQDKPLSDIDLSDLKRQGYSQSEISTAFSWLYDTMRLGEGSIVRHDSVNRGSVRMFHEAEKQVLPAEGRGFLIQLQELGLLDARDLEVVIDRAMMTGYEKLTLEELKEIVAAVLFSKVEKGGRSTLGSGDTIH